MSGRRIELSATQVIASMLAAVTGAIAASYAGVAGTVIGVATMSLASTAGAAVYKHYLGRSRERLRSAVEVIAPHASFNGTAGHRTRNESARVAGKSAAGQGDPAEPSRAATTATPLGRSAGQLSSWLWSPDSPVTEAFPTANSGETAGWSDSMAAAAGRTDPHDPGEGDATQEMAVGKGSDTHGGVLVTGAERAGPDAGAEREPAGPAGSRSGRRHWPVIAGAAIGVFALTLGGITAVEVAAGKPLEALIWGRTGGGTTVGDFTGAQHNRSHAQTRPDPSKPSPAGTPTGTPSPTSTPSPSASHSPSPSRSPSPSPSRSPSPASSSPGPGSASPSASAARS
jgi:hypothetical protein